MMKKKLISIVTVCTVTAAIAGSYAAWDTMSDTASGSVNIRKPITVDVGNLAAFTETEVDGTPNYTSSTAVTLTDVPDAKHNNVQLKLEPKVMDGATDVSEKVDVVLSQDGDTLAASGNALIDSTLDFTAANTYKVTVKPKDGATDIAEKALTVSVTATLEEKPAAGN